MTDWTCITRRRLIAGSIATLVPSGRLFAQQPGRAYRVAIVARPGLDKGQAMPGEVRSWDAWNDELRRLGYVIGQNLLIERHEVEPAGVPDLAATLEADPPGAIFASSQDIVVLLNKESISIPVVTVAVDPVGYGLAESLARPGGRITGFTLSAGPEMVTKRIALLREVSPTMSKLAVLILRPYWEGRWGTFYREVTEPLGITPIGALIDTGSSEGDYRSIFAGLADQHPDGLYITPVLQNVINRRLIAELALAGGMASVSTYRDNVEAGGLMSYGPDLADIYRRAAGYVDRILRGSDPAEMPFQQPTKFDLAVNLKTAAALGLTVPPTLLALADDVFE